MKTKIAAFIFVFAMICAGVYLRKPSPTALVAPVVAPVVFIAPSTATPAALPAILPAPTTGIPALKVKSAVLPVVPVTSKTQKHVQVETCQWPHTCVEKKS